MWRPNIGANAPELPGQSLTGSLDALLELKMAKVSGMWKTIEQPAELQWAGM